MTTADDPDFAREVVLDLYRYRHKRLPVAWLLLVCTGLLGGHRFYLGKPLSGVLYFLSAGGALVLWIRDFTRIRQLVDDYNRTEQARKQVGQPPQSLAFLPPIDQLDLNSPPVWAAHRSGRSVLIGGTVLLAIIGVAMGVIAGATGVIEPAVIMAVFMVITLVAARWAWLRNVPLLGGLSRWNHRLRLYYFTTDPGGVWALAARPVAAVLVAPWRQKSRVEVRLYLQIGIAFGVLFAAIDVYELRDAGFWKAFGLSLAELAQTVVYTYVLVAPAGAILLTQQLLARKDWVVLVMSVTTLGCGYLGLRMVGAV